MVTIELPEVPKGNELEDYVAASLQCGGFYTEKSLIETGDATVMELDIMAWRPTDGNFQHALFEVKGGGWGFPDIFKVYGWKMYLQPRGVQDAYLVAPKESREQKTITYIEDKCADIGLTLVAHNDLDSLQSRLRALGLIPSSIDENDHETCGSPFGWKGRCKR